MLVVAYHLMPGRVAGWEDGAFAAPANVVLACHRAGGQAVLLPAPDHRPPQAIMEPFDGLLMIGGGDVDPSRYGAADHPAQYAVDPGRDELEIGLIQESERRDLPILAMCRGIQILNVAHGGTLHQHLDDVDGLDPHGVPLTGGPVMHEVKLAESSLLARAVAGTTVTGTSHHHQAIDRLGRGLVAVGWSGDGLIEAVEGESGWTVGVQWHPEDTAAEDPTQQAVFDAFVARVGERTGA